MNEWRKKAIKVITKERVKLGHGLALGGLSACGASPINVGSVSEGASLQNC